MGAISLKRWSPAPAQSAGERARVGLSSELGLRPDQLHALAAQFPDADLQVIEAHGVAPQLDVLVTRSRPGAEPLATSGRCGESCRVVMVLEAPNLKLSRMLLSSGVADVLHEPLNDVDLALSLERALASRPERAAPTSRSGEVVALLKAGGGVGATSLGVQALTVLSAGGLKVCYADLDLQWGAAALYLDLPDALNVADCLAAGDSLGETAFIERLATHRCGARVLAAPNEVAPLEMLDPRRAEAIVTALRHQMDLVLIDLPADWTAWTDHLLHMADRVVLVTRLTVGNVQLTKRQLRMLSNQHLDGTPLTLVCNAVTSEQQQALPIKAAERALGRAFDLVIPDEGRAMREALNQGVELSATPRGGKLLKSVNSLAGAMRPAATAGVATR
ncbi:AAA family ATPase [Phenylobacterium soli]|uniref:Uncharacterized protein n=1 Tax=Phenylobacterium soli TaxID=2170551 RepID=A0A328AME7_9CAUL|nr:AAA family ATPase [Phenylobacterium soli]RAK56132.1 hypothetical protein DJ017_17240 [Phenylobacterium soli]